MSTTALMTLTNNRVSMNDPKFLTGLGTRIKQIRAEKKISQVELAHLCAIEKASMSRLESGRTNPTIITLRKISKALDVHISELLKD